MTWRVRSETGEHGTSLCTHGFCTDDVSVVNAFFACIDCRYVVKDLVGSGTFGQVAKCFTEETNEFVAVKVIKNLPAYYTQARFEIGILHMVWPYTSMQPLLAVS